MLNYIELKSVYLSRVKWSKNVRISYFSTGNVIQHTWGVGEALKINSDANKKKKNH